MTGENMVMEKLLLRYDLRPRGPIVQCLDISVLKPLMVAKAPAIGGDSSMPRSLGNP